MRTLNKKQDIEPIYFYLEEKDKNGKLEYASIVVDRKVYDPLEKGQLIWYVSN